LSAIRIGGGLIGEFLGGDLVLHFNPDGFGTRLSNPTVPVVLAIEPVQN
jgi:hypothetical protein